MAATKGYFSVVNSLLLAGADPYDNSGFGFGSAFQAAAIFGHLRVARCLVEARAKVKGDAAIIDAVKYSRDELTRLPDGISMDKNRRQEMRRVIDYIFSELG